MVTKIYVGNLPRVVEEHQLLALFSANGRSVVSVKIPTDPETGRCRGFAFIEFKDSKDALNAIDDLNGKAFLDRPLAIRLATGPNPTEPHPTRKKTWRRQ